MTVKEILDQESQSEEIILKEHLTLKGLAKISHFEAKCSLFEDKYEKSFELFQNELRELSGKEDFSKEDDLLDWEFAHNSLNWWRDRIMELRGAG